MDELTPAERRSLKSRAHKLVPVVLIGDKGLTGAVLAEIDLALSAHELIKIRVQAERADRSAILETICRKARAAPVQHIGKVLVVHRPKPPEPPAHPKSKVRNKAARKSAPLKHTARDFTVRAPEDRAKSGREPFGRPRRPSTSTGKPARSAPRGTERPESRTASPRRAPARPPGRRRTSR